MKKKIAVLYPSFMGGGAEAVCARILEALKDEYELALFTLTNVGFDRLNKMYGTNLSKENTRIFCPFPGQITPLLRYVFWNICPFFPQSQYLLMMYFKNFKEKFDLAISVYNEMDLGQKGIQYIHCPGFVLAETRRAGRISARISKFSRERMMNNITLTLSSWIAKEIKQAYGINARIIYPPTGRDFPDIKWEDKEEGFVCSSRLVPEKEVDKIILILKEVRSKGYNIHLHITTNEGGNPKYKKLVSKLQKENDLWVSLHKGLSHREYCSLVAKHKYGIHARKKEPFGIVVAEMVKAGCIPFVPSEGGPAEIVGYNKFLLFSSHEEAVIKITSMFSDKSKQIETRGLLKERSNMFSEGTFNSEIRKVVREILT